MATITGYRSIEPDGQLDIGSLNHLVITPGRTASPLASTKERPPWLEEQWS